MEFLYKLYDNEYFGIALFIVITILIFLFLIILFFGKKDEKKRKLEETKKLELESTNSFKETNENIVKLEIPEIAQPVTNTINDEQKENDNHNEDILLNIPTLNANINDTLPVEDSKDETIEKIEPVIDINTDFNFDLPVINKNEEEKNINNDLNIDDLFQTKLELPKKEENNDTQVLNMEMPEIKEETQGLPKVEAPFSSVYINKDEEINNNIELPKENVQPLGFELPKMAENNNFNSDKETTEESVKISKVSDFDSLFGDLENETYNIKK